MEQGLDFQPAGAKRRKASVRPIALALVAAFLLGLVAMWFISRSAVFDDLFVLGSEEPSVVDPPDPRVALAGETLAAAEPTPSATSRVERDARQAAAQVERVAEQQGGLDSRVAAMEQRLTRLDLQSQAAAGNAARAEALLIAFASRRAIERGTPLGYLADQLRLRFGDSRPNAVATIIDASQEPVTLAQLLARLDGLAPVLDDAPEGEDVFTRLGREISELFVVRREETPSPVAERRLERARLFLESGRIEAAVSEIRRLPNAAEAADWLDDAERFAAAQRALETLETAAVLDPRELRDGEGTAVEQRSPAGNARRQPD